MSVQEFVTGAQVTIIRLSDPLAEGHLNNSPVEITGLNFTRDSKFQRPAGLKVKAMAGRGSWGGAASPPPSQPLGVSEAL